MLYMKSREKMVLLQLHERRSKKKQRFFSQISCRSFLKILKELLWKDLKELLGFQCSEMDCAKLEKEVTKEEIKEVMFKMPTSKSPGPDGYTSEFCKEAWSVIGEDITIAIQSFFTKGFLPKGLNSTILTLIPKKEEAKMMKDTDPSHVAMYYIK